MKALLLILALPACAIEAQAQGTIVFQATLTGSAEVPPNSDPTIGTGTFSLDANVLSFHVDVPAVTFIAQSAFIQGPALPGVNGPVIFDLGGPTFRPGNDFGVPPGYRFFSPFDGTFGAGPFTLTDAQIAQLESGLWYVNVTSASNPDGQVRGQIQPVPERSAFALLVAGAGMALFALKRKAQ
jgi:hypothetical protein